MGDFEIRTTGTATQDANGAVTTSGVGFIDLDSLAAQLNPVVIDPTLPMIETDDPTRPATASPTNGPHRFTIVVPNAGGNAENSILSVGQAGPADRIQDTGITGMTKTHVHFHTKEVQTMVLLGGPTANHGWSGPNGANNPAASSGFMVVTEGKAWQESRGHQYLMSKDADATLRSAAAGKRVVVQADQGEIDILAMQKIYATAPTITLMAPAAFTPQTSVNYAGAWTADLPETTAGKTAKSITTVLGILTGAHDLGKKVPKLWKSYKKGKKEIETSVTDTAKWGLDMVKWAFTVNKQFKLFSTNPGPGQLKLGADADVGVLAGGDVGIWGGTGFSAGGGIWTSVSGGVSASMKAVGWAGVGGMWTSIKGYRKLDLGSEYGKTSVKAKTEIDITCEDGDTKIGAKDTAQVVADKTAFMVGKDKLVVGGGSGSGTGMVCTQDALKIGMMTKVTEAAAADTDDTAIMMNRNSHMKLKWANSTIEMTSGKIETTADEVKIWAKSGNAEVNGRKVLLG